MNIKRSFQNNIKNKYQINMYITLQVKVINLAWYSFLNFSSYKTETFLYLKFISLRAKYDTKVASISHNRIECIDSIVKLDTVIKSIK